MILITRLLFFFFFFFFFWQDKDALILDRYRQLIVEQSIHLREVWQEVIIIKQRRLSIWQKEGIIKAISGYLTIVHLIGPCPTTAGGLKGSSRSYNTSLLIKKNQAETASKFRGSLKRAEIVKEDSL